MLQNFLEFIFVQARYFSLVFFSPYYFHLSPSIKIWSTQESYVKILPEGRCNSGDKSLSSKMKTKVFFCLFLFSLAFQRSGVPLPSCCGQGRSSVGGVTVPLLLLFWHLPTCSLSLSLPFETSLDSLVRIFLSDQAVFHFSEKVLPV